jgi:hypothetical protein
VHRKLVHLGNADEACIGNGSISGTQDEAQRVCLSGCAP